MIVVRRASDVRVCCGAAVLGAVTGRHRKPRSRQPGLRLICRYLAISSTGLLYKENKASNWQIVFIDFLYPERR